MVGTYEPLSYGGTPLKELTKRNGGDACSHRKDRQRKSRKKILSEMYHPFVALSFQKSSYLLFAYTS